MDRGEEEDDIGNGDHGGVDTDEETVSAEVSKPRPGELPADLPRSLDDRKHFQPNQETEVWDAWQGTI